MKFIQRVDYIMEVEDDILLEYVEYCDQCGEQYSASHFIDWLDSQYFLANLTRKNRFFSKAQKSQKIRILS